MVEDFRLRKEKDDEFAWDILDAREAQQTNCAIDFFLVDIEENKPIDTTRLFNLMDSHTRTAKNLAFDKINKAAAENFA